MHTFFIWFHFFYLFVLFRIKCAAYMIILSVLEVSLLVMFILWVCMHVGWGGVLVCTCLFRLASLSNCQYFWFWFWRYLKRGLIWHLSQSSIRPSIDFSSIVKSSSKHNLLFCLFPLFVIGTSLYICMSALPFGYFH